MATNLLIWGLLFASQLLMGAFLSLPHGPGDTALGMGMVYMLASIFHPLEPETALFSYPSRIAFLAFLVAFGWEIAAPLAHGFGAGYALIGPIYLTALTAPCWVLTWRFPHLGKRATRVE